MVAFAASFDSPALVRRQGRSATSAPRPRAFRLGRAGRRLRTRARLLRTLLQTGGELLPVLLAALLRGLGRLLGDLLAALDGVARRLLRRVHELVRRLAQPLVLDAARRDEQTGDEAHRRRTDGEPERVPLGGVLDPSDL